MSNHFCHQVNPTPWPIVASLAALLLTVGGVMYMHGYSAGELVVSFGMSLLFYSMFVWWRDVIRESTFQGHHTGAVQMGLRYGMILFITFEMMFFVAFFWTFFIPVYLPYKRDGRFFDFFKVFSFYAEWRAAHHMLLIPILLAVFGATGV